MQRYRVMRKHQAECARFRARAMEIFDRLRNGTQIVNVPELLTALEWEWGSNLLVCELPRVEKIRRFRLVLYAIEGGHRVWHYLQMHVAAEALNGALPAACPPSLEALNERMCSKWYANDQSSGNENRQCPGPVRDGESGEQVSERGGVDASR